MLATVIRDAQQRWPFHSFMQEENTASGLRLQAVRRKGLADTRIS